MADIRISKLLRQFNIGLDDLVEFLHKQGVEVDANPNAKVSDEHLPALMKQFGKDLEMKQAADKVEVKITEILEKSGRRPAREEPEEEEPERETIIKSNTFINAKKESSSQTPKPNSSGGVSPRPSRRRSRNPSRCSRNRRTSPNPSPPPNRRCLPPGPNPRRRASRSKVRSSRKARPR